MARADAALARVLRRMVEQVARGPQARSVDIQTLTWEDRARTPIRRLADVDGNEIAAYGIGAYGSAVYD